MSAQLAPSLTQLNPLLPTFHVLPALLVTKFHSEDANQTAKTDNSSPLPHNNVKCVLYLASAASVLLQLTAELALMDLSLT